MNFLLWPGGRSHTSPAQVQAAWDINAVRRAKEIDNDPAYRDLSTLLQLMLEEGVTKGSSVLDAGCGVGALTHALSVGGHKAFGIDPSSESIGIAERRYEGVPFKVSSIEDLSRSTSERYDAIVANMVLHTTDDLDSFLHASKTLLSSAGVLICSIPHPINYLARKRGVARQNREYHNEELFLLRFRVRGQKPHPAPTPFVPRKLSTYLNAMVSAGFSIEHAVEPPQIGRGRSNDVLFIRAVVAS